MADYNINAVTRRVVFSGSAGTGPYAFTFEILDENDIAVYFNATLLTLTTDYTVSINANGTGSVTIVVGTNVPTTPDGDDSITIVGARDIERTTDFVTAGDFRASAINEQLDALTIFDQQISERVDRSIIAPVTDPTTIDMTLPAKADRLGKALLFNSSTGNPEAGPTADEITNVQTYATNASNSATASANSATASATSATLSQDWATKTNGQVASTDYASKAWAIGGTGVTDTASAGAAKEWATEAEDNTVDGTEYSAKHYSAKASASATAAAASAAAAAAAASSNLYSTVTTLTTGTTDVEIANNGTYYLCDTSGGNITINLPAIGTDEGTRFGFQKVGASNSVSFVRDGTDTINGGTSYTLTQDTEVVLLIADDNTPDNWIATIQSQTLADETTITKTGSTFAVKDDGITPAKIQGGVNAQSGTSYTLVIGDAFKTVTMNNASANTLTIPTNASVAFSVGDRIDVVMLGAGTTTITGASGVTLNGVASPTTGGAIAAQYAAASCLKIATDTWLLIGNHGGVS